MRVMAVICMCMGVVVMSWVGTCVGVCECVWVTVVHYSLGFA